MNQTNPAQSGAETERYAAKYLFLREKLLKNYEKGKKIYRAARLITAALFIALTLVGAAVGRHTGRPMGPLALWLLLLFLIVFVFSFGGYELPMLLGATLPKAFPVYTYIEFLKPDFKLRPYAMAMNGITLMLSLLMTLLYAVLMHRLLKKIGGDYER